jgi:hypothetical protein
MLRSVRNIVLWGGLALAGLTASIYAGDDLWARLQGQPKEQMKVGRFYAAMNHWNQVEYSVGTPIIETCVDALMPHFGYVPCWYLRRHTIQQVGNPCGWVPITLCISGFNGEQRGRLRATPSGVIDRRHVRQLEALGFQVTIQKAA